MEFSPKEKIAHRIGLFTGAAIVQLANLLFLLAHWPEG